MQRRTITIPSELGTQIDALVEAGHVSSVSRFFQDAARRHLSDFERREDREKGSPRSAASVHRSPDKTEMRSPWGRLA